MQRIKVKVLPLDDLKDKVLTDMLTMVDEVPGLIDALDRFGAELARRHEELEGSDKPYLVVNLVLLALLEYFGDFAPDNTPIAKEVEDLVQLLRRNV